MTNNANKVVSLRQAASPLERALRHIEAHLDAPLSVAALAEVAGFSPFHFARLFTSQVGESPMSHVRRRRLQLAARRLGEVPPPDLIQLAFDCGFDSQEAFTRAFKQGLGVTPGRFKRNARAMREMMEMPMHAAALPQDRLALLEGLRTRPAFRIAGLAMKLDRASAPQIPELWRRLMARLPIPGQIRGQTGGAGYGVCWASDPEEGGMSYLGGFEVAREAKLPDGIAGLDIPEQTYRVFRLTLDGSSLHPQVQAAMREIYENRIPHEGWQLAEGPDFETYNADFNPMRPGETLEFWIPVKA